ncbi:MAG TPA: helix-turn-helix domain-containing protein [Bacteroidia bacterium]|nr:helix-turn-helix domain-containing protein [Bacteroidia bacterium]
MKPLYSLTVGEFIQLLNKQVKANMNRSTPPEVPAQETEDEFFDITGLIGFLRCSKASVHNYKKQGLPFYRVGRKILFRKSYVLDFMKERRERKKGHKIAA